jgi:vancomycin resistance protein YoaR
MKIQFFILSIIATLSIGSTLWIIKPEKIDKIPYGFTLDGENIGGYTIDNLKSKLKKQNSTKKNIQFKVFYKNDSFMVPLEKLNLKYEINLALEEISKLLKGKKTFWNRLFLKKWAKQGKAHMSTSISYNRVTMGSFFTGLKTKIDKTHKNARIDLIKKKIIPSISGISLDVSNSIIAFEKAILSEKNNSKLVVLNTTPKLSSNDLKDLDLNKILGWYETSFASWGKYVNRAHNLKVGGSKLMGTIVLPGKEISFNKVVGERTAKKGYRVAPIIALGELIDGMGGGMCQIASTLFAAAFFAGMEFVVYKSHSQTSHYIDLGLDATVVYPSVDLVIKNPYAFPVAIRVDVSGGRVRVEILGKTKVFNKIGFERRVVSEKPFKTIFRNDKTMLKGEMKLEQRGKKGYFVRRRRIFFDNQGYELKAQTWSLFYPPTTMIIKVGTKKPDDPENYTPPVIEPFRAGYDPPAFRREIQ